MIREEHDNDFSYLNLKNLYFMFRRIDTNSKFETLINMVKKTSNMDTPNNTNNTYKIQSN